MKITPSKNSFNGHSAGKIEALYLQNANIPTQIPIYNELRNIGQKHDFDVFIQSKEGFLNQEMKYPSCVHCDYELWSQDNKTILNKNGETVVISGLYMPLTEEIALEDFAKAKNIKREKAELFIRGGNIFLGKKPDGKNYLIVGSNDIKVSAMHYYLKEKLNESNLSHMEEFMKKGEIEKEGETCATQKEFDENFKTYVSIVISKYLEIFELEKENLIILPQGQYHNDLAIRPLNYPYVLVSDEKISMENLKKLRRFYKFSPSTHAFVKSHAKKLKEQKESYSNCDELCQYLENAGFTPIRVGGGYGFGTINFINAIVHQNGDDLIYITNSGICKNKNFIFLQTLFEQELKKKCPQISNIYFIKGAQTNKDSNIILEYLKRYHGGIHCLCAEEIEE